MEKGGAKKKREHWPTEARLKKEVFRTNEPRGGIRDDNKSNEAMQAMAKQISI